ncbi:hypothetical protein O181_054046 [Austropuccinia psidii MF-1]|uniref:Uncharacterized protein n=1 Tax=Austropuccinia psidii MF-1 TaxID=1389203 RepID=A0A9Q3HQR2_9BASI|nr:hypothetical protein [Austropuccinia psidii MF-1]
MTNNYRPPHSLSSSQSLSYMDTHQMSENKMLRGMLEQILNKLADKIPEQKPPNEPHDLPNLCFIGSLAELGPFLYAINDHLPFVASNFPPKSCGCEIGLTNLNFGGFSTSYLVITLLPVQKRDVIIGS